MNEDTPSNAMNNEEFSFTVLRTLLSVALLNDEIIPDQMSMIKIIYDDTTGGDTPIVDIFNELEKTKEWNETIFEYLARNESRLPEEDKAYLVSLILMVGSANHDKEDDSFIDAILSALDLTDAQFEEIANELAETNDAYHNS